MEIIWDKTIGGNGSDVASSLSLCKDGSFIWQVRLIQTSGDKTLDSKGGNDFWIVKWMPMERNFGIKQLAVVVMIPLICSISGSHIVFIEMNRR